MRRNNNYLNVEVGNEILENVTEFKYLGVWFDKYLRWYTHIDQTATKISQRLGVIKRLSRYVDQCTHNTLYTALIQPHIDYCCTLWTHGANKYVNRIQILQNQAARLTLGCRIRDVHVSDLYAELKWMQVRQRAEYFKNILMYKCVNGLAPDSLSNGIQSQMITHSYNTKSSTGNSITQSAIRTEIGKRSFKFS